MKNSLKYLSLVVLMFLIGYAIVTFNSGNVGFLVGKDFIGLQKEKIEELLVDENNKNKIIFPSVPKKETKTVFRSSDEKYALLVFDLPIDARILYNPSNGKVVRSIVPGKAHFILEDGLTISIFTPKVLSSPENLGAGSLGKELASGFLNQNNPDVVKDSGEYVMAIYKNDPHDGTKFLKIDPRLMYRGRWVFLKD